MIKRNSDGTFYITGNRNPVTPPDMAAHRQAKATKAEGNPLLGIFGEAMGARATQAKVDQVIARDSVAARAGMGNAYSLLMEGLVGRDVSTPIASALRVVRDFKPQAATVALKTKLPEAMGHLRERLGGAVQKHWNDRVAPARARLAAALAMEVPTEPGAAAAQAIAQMEIRARLGQMPEAERMGLMAKRAAAGDFSVLHAVKSDPLGPSLPPDVMAAAERSALASVGADWLYEQAEDAEAENASLLALVRVAHQSIQSEFRDLGAAESLIAAPIGFDNFAPIQG